MEIKTSESVVELSKALVSVQEELQNPKRTTEAHRYKYAKLEEVINVTKIPLTSNGLSIIQAPSAKNCEVYVTTRIQHTSGEYMESTLTMYLPEKSQNMSQEVGKCITYARRYSLAGMLNIEQEDDDAKSATQSKPKALPVKKSTKKQQEQQDILQEYVNKIKSLVSTDDVAGTKELIGELTDEEKLGIIPKLSEDEVEYLSKSSDKNKGEIR